jgi:hypothetical protein
MVQFFVLKGKKSEGDYIIKVVSYGEVWSLEHILRLLKIIFDSEKCNYPIEKGLRGPVYLLNAITEIAFGRDIELVLADYQLKRKSGSRVQIIEKLISSEPQTEEKQSIKKLHEVLE